MRLLALEALAVAAGIGYLATADPHSSAAVMPRCPIKLATGWDCPSCGGLRMVHDVLHGDLRRAFADNAFLAAASPLLGFLLYRHARAVRRRHPVQMPRLLPQGLLLAAVVWMVVRNLPAWRWKPAG